MSAVMGAVGELNEDTSPRRIADLIFRVRELGIVAVLVVFVAVTALIQPRFVDSQNIKFIFTDAVIFALLAMGETMVVLTRQVDLSVGSVLGLSAYLSSNLFSQVHGIPIVAVFLVGLVIGLACGAVNGAITAIARVPGLVVTLATLYIFRAIDVLVVGGGLVIASTLPSGFLGIPTASWSELSSVPYLTVVVAILVGVVAYCLRSFRAGRELYAIGSNPDAATLAGIPKGKRIFTAYLLCGGIAGLAGVLWAANYQTIDSTAGLNYELTVIAAVVVGGVNIFGGSGTVVGAAFGALLLTTINQALYVLGISSFWDPAIDGLLIVVAISLDHGISVRLTNALRKRNLQHET
ncbi:MAG TPA: ABC transporter permease [Acidimicrobiales bacterium]|nr:ABC transporter permease [Acidimicrobiales bacterium]